MENKEVNIQELTLKYDPEKKAYTLMCVPEQIKTTDAFALLSSVLADLAYNLNSYVKSKEQEQDQDGK